MSSANAAPRPVSPQIETHRTSPVGLDEVETVERCGKNLMDVVSGLEDIQAEGEIEIDKEEEVEPLKLSPDPGQPTEEELEAHRSGGHQPYRCWCKFCVMGRGLGEQHRSRPASTIPRIGIDYVFLSEKGFQ